MDSKPVDTENPEQNRLGVLKVLEQASTLSLNLPTDLTKSEWVDVGLKLGKLQGVCMWLIGEWWNYEGHMYGDRKQIVESDEWDGPSYDTCKRAGQICSLFKMGRRRPIVSFNHHLETQTLLPEQADEVLDWCELTLKQTGKLPTIKQTRERVKAFKVESEKVVTFTAKAPPTIQPPKPKPDNNRILPAEIEEPKPVVHELKYNGDVPINSNRGNFRTEKELVASIKEYDRSCRLPHVRPNEPIAHKWQGRTRSDGSDVAIPMDFYGRINAVAITLEQSLLLLDLVINTMKKALKPDEANINGNEKMYAEFIAALKAADTNVSN